MLRLGLGLGSWLGLMSRTPVLRLRLALLQLPLEVPDLELPLSPVLRLRLALLQLPLEVPDLELPLSPLLLLQPLLLRWQLRCGRGACLQLPPLL